MCQVASTGIGDTRSADRLRRLAVALGTGTQAGPYADAWAVSNIRQLIDPEAIVERYKSQHKTEGIIAAVEWTRNTLIFAPLLVTWFYISRAVAAYSALIHNEPDQIKQPFLYLWQGGFGQQLPWWQTLSWLALIDFTLLFVVLALTMAVYSLSSLIKMRREQEADNLREALVHALAGASLQLATRNWKQPTNVFDDLKKLVANFDTTVTKLMERMEILQTQQKADLDAFVAFKGQLISMVGGLSKEIGGLAGTNTTLASNITSMSTPINSALAQLSTLLKKSDDALTLFRQQITEQGKILTEQKDWGVKLNGILVNLDRTATAGQTIASKQGEVIKQLDVTIDNMVTQQAAYLALVTKQQDDQRQLASDVRDVTINVKRIVLDIGDCARELRGYTKEMNDLVRRAAALV
jgi:hypothetical protein